ncbi:MAG: hypothetical protein RR846_08620, partial [Oscillospiraceae bacterium]
PTSIAVDGVVSFLKFGIEPNNIMFGSTTATFKNIPVSEDMIGKNTDLVNQDDSFKLFGIVHGGEAFEFYNGSPLPLQKGDSLVICELDK